MILVLKIIFAILSLIGIFLYYKQKREEKREGKQDDSKISEVEASLKEAQATIRQQKDTIEGLTAKLSNSDGAVNYDNIQELNANFKKEKSRLENKISELELQLSSYSNSGNNNNTGNVDIVKKLQLETKKLKQDLEDAQDDIEDLKSKFKKEKSQLEGVIADKEAEFKKIQAMNEQLQEANDDLQKSINNKNTSLEFVQEILTAKSADSDEMIRAQHKAIDEVYNFIDGELYSCYDSLVKSKAVVFTNGWEGVNEYYFGTGLKHWALNQRKTWLKGKTTIAFIGEFSSGKTSIVNRLLSQDKPNVPLLPVSTKATTAIPTYISGGISTSYMYYSPDNQLKSITESTFTKVNKEVLDEVKGASRLIKYFVMSYNNPMLNGLSVLDTPGFNSNDSEDSERTIDVINECDALFWVIDINQGDARRQSLELINKYLTKPLFVVINKVDTKSQTEIQAVENKLRDTFKKAGIQVQGFIRFSQKEPLKSISAPLQRVKAEQKEIDFIQDVLEMVQQTNSNLAGEEKNAQKRFSQMKRDCEETNNSYLYSFRNNSELAEEAASIPKWTTHIIRSNKYEMDENSGNKLINILKDIREDTLDTYNRFPALIEFNKDIQKAYENYCNAKENHRQIKKCLDKLTELIKRLK